MAAPSLTRRQNDSSPPHFIGAVQDDWSMFSDDPSDYTIGIAIGFGASSIVYAATYTPKNSSSKTQPIPCALKVLDLDKLPQSALHLLTRETRLMSLSKHPNVLRVRGSWMDGHKVYIAMRLMRKGSVRDVMRYRHIDGVEEEVVKCILKQALEGLDYLHINGFIHRDLKAANLLVDDDGTVLLGDLGVAASLHDDADTVPTGIHHFSTSTITPINSTESGSTQATARPKPHTVGRRRSFVGTPCWMAPEVVAQKLGGYNASADIYSLGITALELTHGRAPHSLDPPHKALMKTLQNASPTLDRSGGANKYSRALKELIDNCLEKDPTKRPTAAELLALPYFRSAKKKDYLVHTLLADLPPLTARLERRKHATILTANSTRSSWDFNLSILSPAHLLHLPTGNPARSLDRHSLRSSSLSTLDRRRRPASVMPAESVFPMEAEDEAASDSDNEDKGGADEEEAERGRPRYSPRSSPHRIASPTENSSSSTEGLVTTPKVKPSIILSPSTPHVPPILALSSPPLTPSSPPPDTIPRMSTSVPVATRATPARIPSTSVPTSSGPISGGKWKKLAGRLSGKMDKEKNGGTLGSILGRTTSRTLGRSHKS